MKPVSRQLLADLKAAALLGDTDSLAAVLERVRALPDADLAPSDLGPLGAALANMPAESLAPWLADPDPGVRGIAAAGLASAIAAGREVPYEMLAAAADDPAEEVRAAFVVQAAGAQDMAASLVERMLSEDDPGPVETGLRLLARTGAVTDAGLVRVAAMDSAEDYAVRTALVETLAELVRFGHTERVLDWLREWAGREEPNVWLIARCASSAWALEHSDAVLEILEKLADQAGRIRPILRAIERHSAG